MGGRNLSPRTHPGQDRAVRDAEEALPHDVRLRQSAEARERLVCSPSAGACVLEHGGLSLWLRVQFLLPTSFSAPFTGFLALPFLSGLSGLSGFRQVLGAGGRSVLKRFKGGR